MVIIAKVLLALLAFLLSGMAFMMFKFPDTKEPDDFDKAWDIGRKAGAVLVSIMAIVVWSLVFIA